MHDRQRTAKKQPFSTKAVTRPCTSGQILSRIVWRTRFDVARKKKNDMHDGQRTAKIKQPLFSATAVPRPYSVATNPLMSAWRTRLLECAAIIAIFAFAR